MTWSFCGDAIFCVWAVQYPSHQPHTASVPEMWLLLLTEFLILIKINSHKWLVVITLDNGALMHQELKLLISFIPKVSVLI